MRLTVDIENIPLKNTTRFESLEDAEDYLIANAPASRFSPGKPAEWHYNIRQAASQIALESHRGWPTVVLSHPRTMYKLLKNSLEQGSESVCAHLQAAILAPDDHQNRFGRWRLIATESSKYFFKGAALYVSDAHPKGTTTSLYIMSSIDTVAPICRANGGYHVFLEEKQDDYLGGYHKKITKVVFPWLQSSD